MKALDAVFSKDEIKNINKITDLFGVISQKQGLGSMFIIRGAQAGGALVVLDGMKDGDVIQIAQGGALMVGPTALARLMTKEKGIALLTKGINLKPGTKPYISNAARIVNFAKKLQDDETNELVRIRKRQLNKIKSDKSHQEALKLDIGGI
jgi:hypothetical protein